MKCKVITLNIWHGGKLWDEALDFIRHEDPDILLMQEVFNSHDTSLEPRFRTVDEYRRLFTFGDYDFAPTMLFATDFGKIEQGNALFSKFPIIRRHKPIFFNELFNDHYVDIPPNYATSPRNLQHVAVRVGDTTLDVFNFQGVWDLDGDNDSPQRLRMSQIIVDAIKAKPNVILAGDTNVRPNTRTIRSLETHLRNIFTGELKTTFNLAQKDLKKFPGYADSVVDMLFASPHIKVVDHYCPNVDVSDHLPLVAIIEL